MVMAFKIKFSDLYYSKLLPQTFPQLHFQFRDLPVRTHVCLLVKSQP